MSISWHSDIFETSTWHSLIPSFIYPFIKYLISTIGFIESNLMTTQRWCASVVSWIQTGVSITLYLSVKMQSTISWDVLVSLTEQGVPTKSLSSHSLHPLPSLDNLLTTLLAQHLHPWNLLLSVQFRKYFFCLDHFSTIESECLKLHKSFSLSTQRVSGELAIFLSPSNQEACF